MNAKKSFRKRESVFKAHVLDKLYPSEKEQDASPRVQELAGGALSKPTPSRLATAAKIYTVQLPPEGLPEAQTQASRVTFHESLESGSSDSESEDNLRPRKRKRKRKHRRKASEVGHTPEILPSSSTPSNLDLEHPVDTNEETQSGTLRAPLKTDVPSLTKNQRRKLRKKRAKLGRVQDRATGRATEFICDVDDQQCPDEGENNAEELKDFMESVWRVFCSDGSKLETVISLTQPFRILREQLASDHLSRETVYHWREVQRLLVLQDFKRARLKLTELREHQDSTSETDSISIFSTLAEYWMTDVHYSTGLS